MLDSHTAFAHVNKICIGEVPLYFSQNVYHKFIKICNNLEDPEPNHPFLLLPVTVKYYFERDCGQPTFTQIMHFIIEQNVSCGNRSFYWRLFITLLEYHKCTQQKTFISWQRLIYTAIVFELTLNLIKEKYQTEKFPIELFSEKSTVLCQKLITLD